jgi:hypothetical protein
MEVCCLAIVRRIHSVFVKSLLPLEDVSRSEVYKA